MIGPKTAQSFVDFFNNKGNQKQVIELMKHIRLVPDRNPRFERFMQKKWREFNVEFGRMLTKDELIDEMFRRYSK